jgi:4,4'-diapophytoene synthase
MTVRATETDRRYCRQVLPLVSRTFALNIRLLGGAFGDAVRVGYLMCRAADALEDSWPGPPARIERRFGVMLEAIEGNADAAESIAREARDVAAGHEDLQLVANYPHVWRVAMSLDEAARAPLIDAVRTMALGMCRYASRAAGRDPGAPYLDTESELHDYCYVVAGCVGEMLTRLATLESPVDAVRAERRLALAPVVGEALQLTNILLDWPADARRGRCHVPRAWLDEWSLTPRDLVGEERPGVRDLARRLDSLARAALAHVPEYVALFPARMIRYRLFCLWPSLWAIGSLRAAWSEPQFPWGAHRPRLPRSELWSAALRSVLFSHGANGPRLLVEHEMSKLSIPRAPGGRGAGAGPPRVGTPA